MGLQTSYQESLGLVDAEKANNLHLHNKGKIEKEATHL